MPHEFDLDGAGGYSPDGKPKGGGAYNPADYGLPVWRDEDHLPPDKKEANAPSAEQPSGMSAEQAKQKLCIWAQEQIGYHEGSGNHNKYADNPDLQKMYGWYPQNQPWCDVFVDVGFISCFGLSAACAMTYQPMGAGSALCKQSAQYYKDHGAFFKTPEPGDQAFFYASGDINHTGIVVRVYGGSVVCVEGNSSDQVAERVYQVGESRIAGYGRPNWAAAGDVDRDTNVPVNNVPDKEEPKKRFYELSFPYLQNGDTGASVTAVQRQLFARGYAIGPAGCDGEFGTDTEAAVRSFQQNNGVAPDGTVGPATGAALFGGETVAPETTEEKTKEPRTSGFMDLITKIWGKDSES